MMPPSITKYGSPVRLDAQIVALRPHCARCARPALEAPPNDVEVVWAKSARGVWGLGNVFDGKLYFTRDICEEKWIPKDLVPPKKSVDAPKARAKAAPQPRGKPAAKRTGLAVQADAKAAAKPAPRAIAASSSTNATHPVPVMQKEHVQQFKVWYSRTRNFFTVPLDPQ